MYYTVYVRGLLNQMVPLEVDYEKMMFNLETGEHLTTAETLLLEQLHPELLDRYFEMQGAVPLRSL